jgi:hypothetical protein
VLVTRPIMADDAGRAERPLPPEFRRDVRLLTTLLGDVIAESSGPEVWRTSSA